MELVETLCIADRLGVLKMVDHICHTHHRRQQQAQGGSTQGAGGSPLQPAEVVGPMGSSVDLEGKEEEEEEERGGPGTPCARVTPGDDAVDGSISDQMAATRIEAGATPAKQGDWSGREVPESAAVSPYSKYIGTVKRLPSPAPATISGGRFPLGKHSTVIRTLYGMGAGHVV